MFIPEGLSIVQHDIFVYWVLVDCPLEWHSLENHAEQNNTGIEHVNVVTAVARNLAIELALLLLQ